MNISALIYNAATGRVDRKISGSVTINPDNQLFAGESWIVCDDDTDESAVWVDINSVPAVIAQRQTYTLDALPLPCVLKIDGERYDITEQPSLSFEWPGTYVINVIPASPAYLEMEFTHTVTEAEAAGVANVEPIY